MLDLQKSFTATLKPVPSPLKKELRDLDITAGAAAVYVGRSYPYVLNQLNGIAPMQPDTEEKIRELIEAVRASK